MAQNLRTHCHTGSDACLDGYFLISEGSGTIRSCAFRGTSQKRFSSICSIRSQGQRRRINP
jgi:hypothetical protein